MKLYKTTFDNKDQKKEIDDILGKSYGFVKSLKLGGTGSHRMLIDKTSVGLEEIMNPSTNVNWASIEFRPNGIIVHAVQGGLKSWAWVIPYYKLYIFHTGGLTIHSDGNFITFKSDKYLKKNKKFISRLVDLRAEYATEFETTPDGFPD